jgi:hypothetical protein
MEEESKNEKEPFHDEWLTRALNSRSQAEARPGLEGRILARLASEREVKSQRRWRWIPALAVAFALLLIVLIGREFLRVGPQTRSDQAKTMQPQPVRPISPVSDAPKVQASKALSPTTEHSSRAHTRNTASPAVAKANALPRLDKFPAEIQATEQEKLMAEIQRRQSTAALAQYARDFREAKDLVIENNSIPPLSPETADEKPNR